MNMTQSQLFEESWIPAKKNYAMKSLEFLIKGWNVEINRDLIRNHIYGITSWNYKIHFGFFNLIIMTYNDNFVF